MRKKTLVETPVFWLDKYECVNGGFKYLVDSMWMRRDEMARNLRRAAKALEESDE